MKRRVLALSAAPAAALLMSAACSAAPGHTQSAATRSAAASRTTAAPRGPFTLGGGQGFDASGAFISLMTCGPHDYSPGLTIANVPAGTAQLALSLVDLQNQKIQWLQVDIPATARELKAHTLTPGAHELLNDFGEATYDGPCPPPGHTHRYRFTLYALHDALPESFGKNSRPRQTLAELQSRSDATAGLAAPYTRH